MRPALAPIYPSLLLSSPIDHTRGAGSLFPARVSQPAAFLKMAAKPKQGKARLAI